MFVRIACAALSVGLIAYAHEPATVTNAVAGAAAGAPVAAPAATPFEGAIMGRITFTGTAPEGEEIDLSVDQACAAHPNAMSRTAPVIVSDDGGLKNVFVWVAEGFPDERYKAPKEPVVVDQVGCTYEPHVFGVMERQDIEFLNSDDTLHNVHPVPSVNKEFNLAMPNKGDTRQKSFKRAEQAIKVKCDVHPWMLSYCFVMEHPFFDTTNDDGTFEIKGLPDGEYEVSAWHETFGTKTAKVTISGGKGEMKVEFASE